uniref:hypothetical protein n=1 Tax=Anaerococcus mediterraneensis TaxID=1870984 RepID=UPI0009311625|nr:hypothetical protein [Anaerococcus mediterraneensis]
MFYKAKGPSGDIIEVTSKTYRVLYESRGYALVDEEEPVIKENLKTDEEKAYKDMSVKELKSLLDEREIPYKGNDKKEKLIELIEG